MRKFYMTFGSQYSYEPHPYFAEAHPDGWVTLVATDYATANQRAFELTQGKFAFLYDAEPESKYFPLGELMEIQVN